MTSRPVPLALRSPFSYTLVGDRAEADRAEVATLRRWLVAEAAASPQSPPGARP